MGKKFISISFFLLTILPILFLLVQQLSATATALPLSTNSRWIVDETGQRVKLACVNWVAHTETMVAEGLSKQPVDAISKQIAVLGFNCVRLTWPVYLVANESLEDLTVRDSFQKLDLKDAIAGIQKNNPSFLDLTLIAAYKRVVDSLGAHNVMVILDNHVSKPSWCCGNTDGNGFFGDEYFLPDRWLEGLGKMAAIFKGVSNVVGMSLRNELRGPRQNVEDWYRYMQEGAEKVHSANPDVLVILSGLSFDADLSFIRQRPVSLSFKGKLVHEVHWYGFTGGNAWVNGNPNQVCGQVVNNLMGASLYLLQQGYPLFVSEFGKDQRDTNENDNRYFNCFMSVAAEFDLDWALWCLVGSYYFRGGVVGLDDVYGVYDSSWVHLRNPSYVKKISAIQYPFQGPGLSETEMHQVIFHPSTGLCIVKRSSTSSLTLGPCNEAENWIYSSQKTLTLKDTHLCLQADHLENPALLGTTCEEKVSTWDLISDTKMHLSSTTQEGAPVCLDVDSSNTIVTSTCNCVNEDKTCDPEHQWFKLVNSTRSSVKRSPASSKSVPDLEKYMPKALNLGVPSVT